MGAGRLTAARGARAAVLAAALAVAGVVAVAVAVGGCGDTDAAEKPAHGTKTATTPTRAVRVGPDDLAGNVGRTVLVSGVAVTARAGATVLLADGTPVYLVGMSAWPRAVEDKRIDARGVLRRRPARVPGGAEPSGGLDAAYALTRARWALRHP